MKLRKVIITALLLTLTASHAFSQNENIFNFPSETKYKEFVPYVTFRSIARRTAKISYTERYTSQSAVFENECELLFDRRKCLQRKYNLIKKQDSLQYICDGISLYSISHKTKEIIIENALEGTTNLVRSQPFLNFYVHSGRLYIPFKKKKDAEIFTNQDFVTLNHPVKEFFLYQAGFYSNKFRTCDLALSEQRCLLKSEKGISELYEAILISLEDENKDFFTEKDFDASPWLENYSVIDKRIQSAEK